MPAHDDCLAVLRLLLSQQMGRQSIRTVLNTAARLSIPIDELLRTPPSRLIVELSVELSHQLCACDTEQRPRAQQLLRQALNHGAHPILITDPAYPASLSISLDADAPPMLFYIGDIALLQHSSAAVVGARAVTPRGAALARACVSTLCGAGGCGQIVSGGAAGVDTEAHHAALAAGADTIVVLPQGILTYDMPDMIRKAVDSGRAGVLSEFVPDEEWATFAAVTRNATISALARLVCVIEPRKSGGSTRTGCCALAQGKRVAVHCAESDPARGLELIRAGGHPLCGGDGELRTEWLADFWRSAPPIQPVQPLLWQEDENML